MDLDNWVSPISPTTTQTLGHKKKTPRGKTAGIKEDYYVLISIGQHGINNVGAKDKNIDTSKNIKRSTKIP